MKVALVQCQSRVNDGLFNLSHHVSILQSLEPHDVELVAFPELSLCHYDPVTTSASPIKPDWAPLSALQQMATALDATIIVGAAVDIGLPKPIIASLVFSTSEPMRVMGKQHLHDDEVPFFSSYSGGVTVLELTSRVGVAICYELSIAQHTSALVHSNIELYLACVAKTATGVIAATTRLQQIANQHKIPTMMVNGLGAYEGTPSGGSTVVIDANGQRLAQLGERDEGVLIINTESWFVDRLDCATLWSK